MADDYGDDSGQRLYDLLVRAGSMAAQRSGLAASEAAIHDTASRLEAALAGMRNQLVPPEAEAQGKGSPTYAKLDVRELAQVEGFAELRGIIHSDLESHGVGNGFVDGEDGRTHLVFKVEDAPRVAECLDRLIEETKAAAARAGRDARGRGARERDPKRDCDGEPLEDRGRRAREASAAMRGGGTERHREEERVPAPRREERSK